LEYSEDGWKINEVDGFITGETSMDNFNMAEFLDIIGVHAKQITWGVYGPELPKDDEDLAAYSEHLDKKKRWETLMDELRKV